MGCVVGGAWAGVLVGRWGGGGEGNWRCKARDARWEMRGEMCKRWAWSIVFLYAPNESVHILPHRTSDPTSRFVHGPLIKIATVSLLIRW